MLSVIVSFVCVCVCVCVLDVQGEGSHGLPEPRGPSIERLQVQEDSLSQEILRMLPRESNSLYTVVYIHCMCVVK